MRNRMYGGVRGRKTRVGEKLHRFPPTRFALSITHYSRTIHAQYTHNRRTIPNTFLSLRHIIFGVNNKNLHNSK